MILKALYDYYIRSKKCNDSDVPALGFDIISVDMVLLISTEGKLLDIMGECEGVLPRPSTNKTSGDTPNILYDKADYIINIDKKKKIIPKEISKRCQTEIDIVNKICEMFPNNTTFHSVKKFYDNKEFLKIPQKWKDKYDIICSKDPLITFKVHGECKLVSSYSEELEVYIKSIWEKNPIGRCLVTGKENVPLMKTTASTPLGIATNGKIVSFQSDKGFDSYGKIQGANAPISIEAECAFSYSLKALIKSQSNNIIFYKRDGNKRVVAKMLVFWASKKELEPQIFSFLCPADNPNERVKEIKDFFNDIINKGRFRKSETYYYYFLELFPTSKGRIAISFWNKCKVEDFAYIVNRHMEDYSICDNDYIGKSPIDMLNSVSLRKDHEYEYNHRLVDSIINSIITGTKYPFLLYQSAIKRIFAEQNRPKYSDKKNYFDFEKKDAQRAAICRAFLNRNFRYNINTNMDKNIKHKGYLCGRLFAILERTQEIANYETTGEWKSQLRTKYMNTAMTRPSVVMPIIMANSNYYLDKLKNIGWIEDLKKEIISKLDGIEGFPSYLNIQEQGLFFIGYYQQRNELLNSKKSQIEDIENNK